MKAISIWQPYASLVAVGAKRFETRSWPAHAGMVGEHIAILSGKNTRDLDVAHQGLHKEVLDGAADAGRLALVDNELPLGFILCTALLRSCEQMGADLSEYSPREQAFGWFGPERWAWEITEIQRLPEIKAWRGAQGVFNVPDSVLR